MCVCVKEKERMGRDEERGEEVEDVLRSDEMIPQGVVGPFFFHIRTEDFFSSIFVFITHPIVSHG